MLNPGKAVKVTIYLSEGATHHGVPVYSSILDFLFYRGAAGATVTKGIAGFGADHHMHSSTTIEIADRLPLKIEFIDSREKVGKAQMMRIFLSEEDRWKNKPLHEALVEAMRANDIAGVTVYRGILGYGAGSRIRRASLFSKGAPIQLSVVDTEEQIARLIPFLDAVVQEGLVATSAVEATRYTCAKA
jgi:PII-like signaling protein